MQYDNYENITFNQSQGILTVTLNRPDALNATDEHLHRELSRVFADIAGDKETRAVILTGAGPAFCAGGDLKHALSMNRDQTNRPRLHTITVTRQTGLGSTPSQ